MDNWVKIIIFCSVMWLGLVLMVEFARGKIGDHLESKVGQGMAGAIVSLLYTVAMVATVLLLNIR